MSTFPPPPSMQPGLGAAYSMPAQTRTSTAAIVSLICGVLGCLMITAVIAIVSGIVGLMATRHPNVKGRGMAVVGIALGLMFGAIGGGLIYGGFWAYGKGQQLAGQTATPFVQALVSGDTATAQNLSNLTPAEIDSMRAQMNTWGDLTDLQFSGFQRQASPAGNVFIATGTATFSKAGKKRATVTLDMTGGTPKVVGVQFE